VRIAAALALGLALGFGAAAAEDDAAARQQVEQRLKLIASMMADGGSAQRITASGNPRASALLDEGRVHQALAVELLAKGDLANARRSADEALKQLGQARRLVPDAPARQNAARQRQEQMLASLERLIDAWGQRIGPSEVVDGDLFSALGLIATAKGFAGEGRFEEAVWTLGAAEGHVLTGMNRVMHARTLDYTARASTPAEEFQLEMARHRSLTELVPLAVNDLKPRGDALALIERYSEASGQLRQQAQAQFQAGDLPQALAHLRNALMYVQRALTSAGLVVPPSTESATGSTP
jgi:tetratricopeptide (TPR) repeat protein